MRAIYLASLDKVRPVLMLTRAVSVPVMTNVTVAPITSTVRGHPTEVHVGPLNGLARDSVVNCSAIATIPVSSLQRQIGVLLLEQERALAEAVHAAFDLF